jgi:hypothetical protein
VLCIAAERSLFEWVAEKIRQNLDPTEEEVREQATFLRRQDTREAAHVTEVRSEYVKAFVARHPQLALAHPRLIEQVRASVRLVLFQFSIFGAIFFLSFRFWRHFFFLFI